MEFTTSAAATEIIRLSLSERFFRGLLSQLLQSISGGEITISDGAGETTYGVGDLTARIVVRDSRFYLRVVLGGGLGAAEALRDGDWECDNLTNLVRIFIRNLPLSDRLDRRWGFARWLASRVGHALRANTLAGSRRNIQEHYDLSNDFYQLWLDETMSYSSAIFPTPEISLADASRVKLDLVCRKLELRPEDHLLEIGTGWGGLALHAAQNFGCRVTTTTISQEQYRFAVERVHAAGLADRITILRQDYRELTGQYDKLVSIEMIEAVGEQYFGTFFEQCGRLLKPDGMLLLQSIVIADERYAQHLRSVDFIRQYIFPGGCLPSISVLTQAAAQASGMRLVHLEDIAPHYAETLRRWRNAFHERLPEIRELGFDEPFLRIWNYYLCYCEAAFEERQVNNVQMLLAKRDCRVDPVLQRHEAESWFRQESLS